MTNSRLISSNKWNKAPVTQNYFTILRSLYDAPDMQLSVKKVLSRIHSAFEWNSYKYFMCWQFQTFPRFEYNLILHQFKSLIWYQFESKHYMPHTARPNMGTERRALVTLTLLVLSFSQGKKSLGTVQVFERNWRKKCLQKIRSWTCHDIERTGKRK